MMTSHEKEKITDLRKCNFNEINDYFKAQSEARKNRSKEEKQVSLDLGLLIVGSQSYIWCDWPGN